MFATRTSMVLLREMLRQILYFFNLGQCRVKRNRSKMEHNFFKGQPTYYIFQNQNLIGGIEASLVPLTYAAVLLSYCCCCSSSSTQSLTYSKLQWNGSFSNICCMLMKVAICLSLIHMRNMNENSKILLHFFIEIDLCGFYSSLSTKGKMERLKLQQLF